MSKYCDNLERGFSVLHKTRQPASFQTHMHDDEDRKIAVGESIITYRLLKKLRSFSEWYIQFLIEELQPTASYQRHITALKMIETMMQVAINGSCGMRLFDPTTIVDDQFNSRNNGGFGSSCVRLILDLVVDPFDDVRLVSSSILKKVFWNMHSWNMDFKVKVDFTFPSMDPSIFRPHVLPHRTYNTYILQALCKAEEMMYLTGRADHADGVGRLYSLLYDSCKNLGTPVTWSNSRYSIMHHILSALENDIKIARKDLRLAVTTAPLHGRLISLRYLILLRKF